MATARAPGGVIGGDGFLGELFTWKIDQSTSVDRNGNSFGFSAHKRDLIWKPGSQKKDGRSGFHFWFYGFEIHFSASVPRVSFIKLEANIEWSPREAVRHGRSPRSG